MTAQLPFTGERFVPGVKGEIWVEHWHRYHFAARWTAGKRVLDVACGEGYGTALLARHAAHVTGVDVSEQAIAHARAAYAALANVAFARASCTRLPLADASVDVAVSFETLEHIAEQERFVDELARVLRPDGVLLLSCPNKLEYSDKRDFANEFHVKELYRDELARLVAARFPEADWYGQRPSFFSAIVPESLPLPEGEGRGEGSSQFLEVSESAPGEAARRLSHPLYFILAASRSREALARVAPALSLLADRDDWVHRDYEKVMRELEGAVRRREDAERELAERGAEIGRLQERVRALDQALALQEAALAAQKALVEVTAAAHRAELAAKDHEIDRRRGWRWWLRLPLVRLGLLD